MTNQKVRNYTVTDEILGTGGMGVVYRGVREFSGLDTHEAVACKVIRAELAPDDDYQKLFLREAFTAMSLAHPYLVQVHDCIRQGETIYLFMELIDGVSLETLIRHHGPLAENLVATIIHRVAQALAYLHSQGICHRDISPPNILISKQGQIKVSDFGLALPRPQGRPEDKPDGSKNRHLSPIGFKGRLPFACPVCLQAQRQTSSSDVWALLVTAYYAASGYLPFGPNTGDSLDPCLLLERIVMQDFALPDQPFSAPFRQLVRDLNVMESGLRKLQTSQAVADYLADNFAIQPEMSELATLVQSVADGGESQVVNRKKPKRYCPISDTDTETDLRSLNLSFSSDESTERNGRSKQRPLFYLVVLVLFCFVVGDRPGEQSGEQTSKRSGARPELARMADDKEMALEEPICSIAATSDALEPVITSYREPEPQQPKARPKKRAANKRQAKKRRKKKPSPSGVFVLHGKSY